jgi:DNA-binding NarL/FixJ family response regulator
MRQGLRKILEERRDWRVVGEAGNGRDAVRDALALHPDVAVLDIGMPVLNGIEATRQIVRRAPAVRVLILSMHDDQAYITQAVQAGARGYLLKDSAGTDLVEAVAAVAGGKSFFSPSVTEVMLDDILAAQALPGLMEPDDVAGVYLFLASDHAASVTGQAYSVDRGEVMA